MARTESTMLEIGTLAPDFSLPDVDGVRINLAEFHKKGPLLVIFMCNHCPYVLHILPTLVPLLHQYQQQGLSVVAINSNDVSNYPDDSPEKMQQLARGMNFRFPYLYDEDQSVAQQYRAACTPDFFLFDAERRLQYRGQFDGARPGNDVPVTGSDLAAAIEALLAGRPVNEMQVPSMGCNIKWKAGNEPDYFGSAS